MYDSAIKAFEHSAKPAASQLDIEAERLKLTDELISQQITTEHPKVKDLISEACLQLQDRMHN